jgi:hypothetical protein
MRKTIKTFITGQPEGQDLNMTIDQKQPQHLQAQAQFAQQTASVV